MTQPAPEQRPPEVSAHRRVYDGKLFQVDVEDVRLPSGRESKREIVRHPGAVALVVVDQERRLLLVRQYRRAADRRCWRSRAGTREPDEDAEACARARTAGGDRLSRGARRAPGRLLLRARLLHRVPRLLPLHRPVARDLRPEEDEDLSLERLSLDDAWAGGGARAKSPTPRRWPPCCSTPPATRKPGPAPDFAAGPAFRGHKGRADQAQFAAKEVAAGARLVLFIDDGGVMNDSRAGASAQWRALVGEFFAPRLGGTAEAWAAANCAVSSEHAETAAWTARMQAVPDYAGFDRLYLRDWLQGMCENVGVPAPPEEEGRALARQITAAIPPQIDWAYPGAEDAIRRCTPAATRCTRLRRVLGQTWKRYLERHGRARLFRPALWQRDWSPRLKMGPQFYTRIFAHAGRRAGIRRWWPTQPAGRCLGGAGGRPGRARARRRR